jgi:hypothetical protein
VARLPLGQQALFADFLRTARQDVKAGVVAAKHHERQRSWKFWTEFVESFQGGEWTPCPPKMSQTPTELTSFSVSLAGHTEATLLLRIMRERLIQNKLGRAPRRNNLLLLRIMRVRHRETRGAPSA